MTKKIKRLIGLILSFGLCITMLSKVAPVSAAENEPKLNVSSVSVILNGSYRLKVYNLADGQYVTYRSSDPSIADVSPTGKVTGNSCGTTVVTATVRDDHSTIATLRCEVLIGPAAVSIKLTKTAIVLQVGKSKLLRTVIYPLNTVEEAKFYSTASDVAKVSTAGRVRAASEGVTQVYAILMDGTYDVCEVTVLSEENYQRYRDGEALKDILMLDDEEEEDTSEETPTEEPKATEAPKATDAPASEDKPVVSD